MKTKSVLPWFGSDASVAANLGVLLDGCNHVTIPFAGGMSILPHLKAKAIVANDLHRNAICFYQSLSGRYGEKVVCDLVSICEHTLSHPEEMEQSENILNDHGASVLLKAWAFWAQCWIGRKGKGGTKHQGGKPSVRRTANGGNNATRIKSAAADLKAWAEEFRRCEFTCEDFGECLRKVSDKPKCGVYCDPPWFGAGRNYLHEFSPEDHRDLASVLSSLKNSPIVIRYGDCGEVRHLYRDPSWTITEATSRTQANKNLGEIWITNF